MLALIKKIDTFPQKIIKEKASEGEKKLMEHFPATNPNPVLSVEKDGTVLYSNEASKPLLHEWGAKIGEKLPSSIIDILQKVITQNNPGKIEVKVKNSTYLLSLHHLPEEECINIYGFDISCQKELEEKLRSSEERLLLAQQVAKIGAFEWNIQTGVNIWTPELEAIYGLQPGEFNNTEEAWQQLIHPEDRQKVVQLRDQSICTGETTEHEWRIIWSDGSVHWLSGRWQVIKDETGKALRLTGVNIDITEKKRHEEIILAIKAELELITDSTPVILNRLSRDLKFIFANRACYEMLGRTREEIIGKSIVEILGEDAFEKIRPYVEKVLQGQRVEYETEIPYKGVSPRFMQVVYIPERNLQGEVVGWLASITDITERKYAEEALQENEALFSAFMDNNPANAWMKDEQGAYIFLNKASVDRIGIERENFLGKTDFEVFPHDADQLRKNDSEVLASNKPIAVEEETVNPDGRCIQWLSFKFPFKDAFGKRYVGGISVDITERKKMEEQTRQRAEELETLMDVVPVAIFISHDPECNNITGNLMANKLYEAKLGENVSANVSNIRRIFYNDIELSTDELPMQKAAYEDIDVRNKELVSLLPSGEKRTVIGSASPLHDAKGNIRGSIGAFIDITERKRAEEALHKVNERLQAQSEELQVQNEKLQTQSEKLLKANNALVEGEERFRTMANAIPQLAWIAKADGYIYWYNDRWYAYTGTTPEQMKGWGWQSVHDPAMLPKVLKQWNASIATGQPFDMEFPLRGADGLYRMFLTRAFPLKDAKGQIIQWFGTNTDISERKQEEYRILRYNRIQEGINRILSNVVQAKTEEELGNTCLSVALELTGGGIGFVNIIGDDRLMHNIAISEGGWNQCLMHDQTGHRRPSGNFIVNGLYGHVVTSGKGFFTNNPPSHPQSIGLPLGHPELTSFLGVPLLQEGKAIGMLGVANREGGYSCEQLEDLEAIAPAVTQALKRKKVEETLKKVLDNLEIKVKERTAELEKAYNSLKENERNLTEAQEIGHFGSWERNIATNKLHWSDEMYRIFGLKPQEFEMTYDLLLNHYVHPDDRDYFNNAVKGAFNGTPYSINYRIILRDGEERIVHAKGEVIFDDQNNPVRIRGTTQDITESRRTEERIHHLANVVESSSDAIGTLSLDGITTSWNKGAEQIYGYLAEEVLGTHISIPAPPHLKNETQGYIELIKQTGMSYRYTTSRLKKNGEIINLSITLSPVFDNHGKLTAISFISRDITEQKRSEDKLRESEKRLRFAQQAAKIGAFEWNITTGVNTWTPELEAMYGLKPGEFNNTEEAWQQLIHPEDRQKVVQLRDQSICAGEPTEHEWRIIWSDGSVHWLSGRWQVIKDETGKALRLTGVNIDITEKKRTEEIILAKEAELELITNNTPIMLNRLSSDLRYIFVNCAYADMLGRTQEEIIGKPIVEIMGKEAFEIIRPYVEKVLQGQRVVFETEVPYKGVSPRFMHAVYIPERNVQGEVMGWFASITDITERKKAEEALKSFEIARKKELHHRIKNNLQVISSLLDLQADMFKGRKTITDSEVLKAFKESIDRVLSIALIHEELYKGKNIELLNFSQYIEELVNNLLLTYRVETNVSLHFDLMENILLDMDTAIPLGIVVNELVSNSFKYAFSGRDKGEIRIKLHREGNGQSKSEEFASTAYVLSVSDNGIGIPEDLDIEELNSLGLQLVTTLVDQLDGKIELKRDNGTEFTIRFKVTEKDMKYLRQLRN